MIYERPLLITLASDPQDAAGACVTGISNQALDTTGCAVGVHAPNGPCATGTGPDDKNYACVTGTTPGTPGNLLNCLAGGTAGTGAGSCSFGGVASGGGAGSCDQGFTPS